MVPDRHRDLVGAGVTVLFLPDTAAFDQTATWRAAENAVRGGHRNIACDRLDGDVDIEGQGGDRTDVHGGVDISASNLMQSVVIAVLLHLGVALMVRG